VSYAGDITPEQAWKLLGEDPEAVLVDVRTDAEHAQAKIEGSTHIPLHLLPLKLQDLNDGQPVVVYCRSGARSAQACAWLMSQGIENVYNLAGGIMAWARDGKALAA